MVRHRPDRSSPRRSSCCATTASSSATATRSPRRASSCCSCRGPFAPINGAYLSIRVGSLSIQPAEFAKIAIVIFLASYLRDTRQVLLLGVRAAWPWRDDPAAQALRAAARGLGLGDDPALLHPRHRLVADVLRRLPGDALRRDEPAVVRRSIGLALFAARRLLVLGHIGHDRRPRRRLAGPVRPRAVRQGGRRQLPARAVAVRPGRRRAVRRGLRPVGAEAARQGLRLDGQLLAAARAAHGLHLRGDRQRARASSARAACSSSTCSSSSAASRSRCSPATRSPSCWPSG